MCHAFRRYAVSNSRLVVPFGKLDESVPSHIRTPSEIVGVQNLTNNNTNESTENSADTDGLPTTIFIDNRSPLKLY